MSVQEAPDKQAPAKFRPGTYALRGVLGEHESVFRGRRDFKLGHAADTVHVRVLPAGAP